MPDKPAVLAEAARLRALFEAAGAVPVEADVLQPADTLLDLYGEDIRACPGRPAPHGWRR